MAKSKLEKLKEVIETARTFLLEIVIGSEVGQYNQSDVDDFTSVVDAAGLVAENNDLEPIEYDKELVVVNDALAVIQGKVISEQVITASEPTTKVVKFKGTASQCNGSHTLHYKQSVISFKDGKAELSIKLADELLEAGYVE